MESRGPEFLLRNRHFFLLNIHGQRRKFRSRIFDLRKSAHNRRSLCLRLHFRCSRTILSPQSRRKKSERLKNVGEPLQLPGKALAIEILENDAWVAENTTVARKIDLVVSDEQILVIRRADFSIENSRATLPKFIEAIEHRFQPSLSGTRIQAGS